MSQPLDLDELLANAMRASSSSIPKEVEAYVLYTPKESNSTTKRIAILPKREFPLFDEKEPVRASVAAQLLAAGTLVFGPFLARNAKETIGLFEQWLKECKDTGFDPTTTEKYITPEFLTDQVTQGFENGNRLRQGQLEQEDGVFPSLVLGAKEYLERLNNPIPREQALADAVKNVLGPNVSVAVVELNPPEMGGIPPISQPGEEAKYGPD